MRKYFVITGLLSVVLGAYYLFYPVIEAEARSWGELSILGGLLAALVCFFNMQRSYIKVLTFLGFALLGLAQILPILMWMESYGLTDDPSGIIEGSERLMALPHVAVLVLCALICIHLLRSTRK